MSVREFIMYCFRHRFEFPRSRKLGYDERRYTLAGGSESGELVYVTSLGDMPLKDADHAALQGEGFQSEEDARSAADYWRGVLERSFAAVRLGADFQDRAARGGMSAFLRAKMMEERGRLYLNDYGLNVYACEPRPVFERANAVGVAVSARANWEGALQAAKEEPTPTAAHRLAYDIFSGSFAVDFSPEARVMMLMMSLETLIEQQKRDEPVRSHVDELIAATRAADLPRAVRDSLEGSLRWLYIDSVSQAGKRLAESLGDREYDGMSPAKFFERCYKTRSALAHGHVPRPSRDEVARLAATLEVFVGHLLAGIAVVRAAGQEPVT